MTKPNEYEVGLIRTDSGKFLDKGNKGVDPTHPDFAGQKDIQGGGVDAREAFAAADEYAQQYGLDLIPNAGTYRIDSNLTLTSGLRMSRGATIKPASGVTVTINGPFEVGLYQVFDTSAGGSVVLGSDAVDFVRPEWTGVLPGNADNTDELDALISLAPSNAHIEFQPGQTYVGNLPAPIDKPLHIDFKGSTLESATDGQKLINIEGSLGSTAFVLASGASRGDRALTFTADVSGEVSAGDLVLLRDDTTRAGDGAQNVNLEVHEVKSVSTTQITLRDRLRIDKAVASSDNMRKITPVEDITIRNVVLKGFDSATSQQHGIYFRYCRNVFIENVTMTKVLGHAVSFLRSYNCSLENFDLSEPTAVGSGQGEGVAIGQGTNKCTVRNGVVRDLRRAIDSNNSMDLLVSDVAAYNITDGSAAFGLSHNGWDADSTWETCRLYGSGAYGFIFAGQAADNYTLRAAGITIRDSFVQQPVDSFNVAVYFQVPMEDCLVDNVVAVQGTGALDNTNGTTGFRALPTQHKRSMVRDFRALGYRYGAQMYDATNPAADEDFDGLAFSGLRTKNCDYGVFTQHVTALHIEDAEFEDVGSYAIWVNATSLGNDLRYLVLDGIKKIGSSGALLNFDRQAVPSTGIIGRVRNVALSTTNTGALTPTAGTQITLEQMLTQKDGSYVRLAPASSITLDDPPLEDGLVEGQRVAFQNATTYTVTFPFSAGNVLNHGNQNVTIGSETRVVEYVWSAGYWTQVQAVDLVEITTAADGDATPNVLGVQVLKTANTGATTITDFDGTTRDAIRLTVIAGDANTTVEHNANIQLRGAVDRILAVGEVINFVSDSGIWRETGSSVDPTNTYTQTYSTADRTHAARTAQELTDSTTGTAGDTISAISGSGADSAINNALASLIDEINKLRSDHLDTAQVVNALLDDLQTRGDID